MIIAKGIAVMEVMITCFLCFRRATGISILLNMKVKLHTIGALQKKTMSLMVILHTVWFLAAVKMERFELTEKISHFPSAA